MDADLISHHANVASNRSARSADARASLCRVGANAPAHHAPDAVFEQLCRSACERRLRGLRAVHKACQAIAAIGGSDFRLCTVGPLVEQLGGPTTRSMSNSWGKPYRMLIDAHSHAALVSRQHGARGFYVRPLGKETDPDVLRARIVALEGRCAALQREVNRLSYTQSVQNKS